MTTAASRPAPRSAWPVPAVGARAMAGPLWRAGLLVGGLALLAATAGSATLPAAPASDPGLNQLLRGMALIKGLLCLVAVVLVYWRLGRPIAPATAALCLLACWAMAAAALMIWQLRSIPWAALAFHVGEMSLLLMAWRDRGRHPQRRETACKAATSST